MARAFLGVPGFRVVVLFPDGRISEPQRKLITKLGGNVSSLAVAGSFDDCQRLVKEAFADRCFAIMDDYAPNFRRSVIARQVLAPKDIEDRFALTGVQADGAIAAPASVANPNDTFTDFA